MFVELIEHLRCPAQHEPTALVVAATRAENRHILDGILGCPQCGAEYRVRDGITRLGDAPPVAAVAPAMDVAMRLAAFLELTDPRGFAVLSGAWCAHAEPLSRLVETPLVLVNPPEGAVLDGASAVLATGGPVPIAEGAARALALDTNAVRADTVAVVRTGGRVVAPANVPTPPSLREIARDGQDWVAERVGDLAPRLVGLTPRTGRR